MAVDIVILAAGKGTRMRSRLPKVLHELAGKPLLGHVIDTARQLNDSTLSVVVGHGAELVRQRFPDPDIQWVEQGEQLGTGHAVLQALPHLRAEATTLVLYGDVPLIEAETLATLVELVRDDSLALLTVTLDQPTGYGRILRNADGRVTGIVEEKDATPAEKLIREVNTGVMAVPAGKMAAWLPTIGNSNAQGEYYLTDLIAIAHGEGLTVATHQPASAEETEGVNSRAQLQVLERYFQRRIATRLMDSGVTLADAGRFDCRGQLSAGEDCFIDVNTVFEGTVVLGAGVRIGPNCQIRNATIGDGATIKANTVIEGPVTLAAGVEAGPFARLRPGTVLHEGARIGNFVEIKKADIGTGSKVNHLSYIGDAVIGSGVNVGAGTITCNYDGVNKFTTTLHDGAFIGSNTSLVAPVTVGAGATVGAGSTVTRDVPAGELTVARGKQRNITGWQRPVKQQKD
ncbi:MAG: bifunctional UDP-N-acetylglucosamine diphosphorylase/glucosamine-1-phosphate N-acetyltransferase GlmU [Porticoccaceae bacterium]|nr:bifunctional UDP-N-acetylglucosamine diphosphorylase/glucosamine-1-phosphate N-acetyltransferase GlmU [Porticoccaceae bacterium]